MGSDSVTPFLAFENKWVILLALTSNQGATDFQTVQTTSGEALYKTVLRKAAQWGTEENLMFVVGATRAEMIAEVRNIVPDHFFLVPGVGAQGGSLEEVVKYGWTNDCGLLINSSRGIIYASSGKDFAEKAAEEALKIQTEMAMLLEEKGF
jgi:orotidine-5'-phosphate decarboxylase